MDRRRHPLQDPQWLRRWEERAEALLREVPYSSDLGKRACLDAIRVVAGELSEEEFYRRYHEEYLRVFGEDQRPLNRTAPEDNTPEQGEGGGAGTADPPTGEGKGPGGNGSGREPDGLDRRAFLKAMALGMALLAGGTTALTRTGLSEAVPDRRPGDREDEKPRGVQMGISAP